MENEKLLDAQALLKGYQWALGRASGPAAIAAAEKGIREQQHRILNLQDGPSPEDEGEESEWNDHLDGPSPSYIIQNSDPSVEWTAEDFE